MAPITMPTDLARVRLTLAYDGTGFRGFAAQPGIVTVAGTLAATIARVLHVPEIELTCAGRTDAGVHAWGQVVSFDVPSSALDRYRPDLLNLRQAINRLCGPAVVVRDATIVDGSFDARFSAKARLYRYTVLNRPVPDPFLATSSWHVTVPLELRAMEAACDALIGTHDFSSFCRRPRPGNPDAGPVPLTRRVRNARWDDAGDGVLYFWIEANAFCHQMVRSIVGTLVEVGRGKKRAGDLRGIMRAGDRTAAGDLAPPHGLCLWDVRY